MQIIDRVCFLMTSVAKPTRVVKSEVVQRSHGDVLGEDCHFDDQVVWIAVSQTGSGEGPQVPFHFLAYVLCSSAVVTDISERSTKHHVKTRVRNAVSWWTPRHSRCARRVSLRGRDERTRAAHPNPSKRDLGGHCVRYCVSIFPTNAKTNSMLREEAVSCPTCAKLVSTVFSCRVHAPYRLSQTCPASQVRN